MAVLPGGKKKEAVITRRPYYRGGCNAGFHCIPGNSLNLPVTAVISQHSRVTLLPSDIKDFAMLTTQRFWQETYSFIVRCHVTLM